MASSSNSSTRPKDNSTRPKEKKEISMTYHRAYETDSTKRGKDVPAPDVIDFPIDPTEIKDIKERVEICDYTDCDVFDTVLIPPEPTIYDTPEGKAIICSPTRRDHMYMNMEISRDRRRHHSSTQYDRKRPCLGFDEEPHFDLHNFIDSSFMRAFTRRQIEMDNSSWKHRIEKVTLIAQPCGAKYESPFRMHTASGAVVFRTTRPRQRVIQDVWTMAKPVTYEKNDDSRQAAIDPELAISRPEESAEIIRLRIENERLQNDSDLLKRLSEEAKKKRQRQTKDSERHRVYRASQLTGPIGQRAFPPYYVFEDKTSEVNSNDAVSEGFVPIGRGGGTKKPAKKQPAKNPAGRGVHVKNLPTNPPLPPSALVENSENQPTTSSTKTSTATETPVKNTQLGGIDLMNVEITPDKLVAIFDHMRPFLTIEASAAIQQTLSPAQSSQTKTSRALTFGNDSDTPNAPNDTGVPMETASDTSDVTPPLVDISESDIERNVQQFADAVETSPVAKAASEEPAAKTVEELPLEGIYPPPSGTEHGSEQNSTPSPVPKLNRPMTFEDHDSDERESTPSVHGPLVHNYRAYKTRSATKETQEAPKEQ